jgi:AraC-like DNA-binding protein
MSQARNLLSKIVNRTAASFPAWKGFEFAPEGRLLAQQVDLGGPMGFAYERSVGFEKTFHVHDRMMLLFPRGGSSMRVIDAASRRSYEVDSDSVLCVPKDVPHADASVSVVYDTFALFPSQATVDAAVDAAVPTATTSRQTEGRRGHLKPVRTPRSRWLAELVERYFIARVLRQTVSRERLDFFEREILLEALGSPVEEAAPAAPVDQIFERSMEAIEANLFAPFDLAALGKRVGGSTSTLLRSFRREINQTPYTYVMQRRLDEAKRLLERGEAQVQEVALLVGYQEVASFSRAYRKRFGVPPSAAILARKPARTR